MHSGKFDKLLERVSAEGQHGALREIMNAADAVFHKRHPELRGAPLNKSSPEDLKTEWGEIFRTQTKLAMTAIGSDAKIIEHGA